jgi:N-acetylglucosaminyl-diphospho-decaprenol L-rhamnosyltransferase
MIFDTTTPLAATVNYPSPPLDLLLSVVIVNWNTRDLLAQCLQSIMEDCGAQLATVAQSAAYQPAQQRSIEVFVVDNASSDRSVQMITERFPWVRLIRNAENLGFAQANNQAIDLAHGKYVLLLNSDTEVHPGAFAALTDFMERTPQAGAAGAHLLNGDGTLQPACQPMLTPWREFLRLLFLDRVFHVATYASSWWETEEPRQTEVIKGACLMLRHTALDQAGLLDGSYFMYTEEVDLCYRLAQAGWQLWWVPAAKVTHFGEASSRQAAQTMYVQLYRSKIQFYRKYGGEHHADLFKRLLRVAYWPRFAAATLFAPLSPSLNAKARTYRDLLTQLPTL